MSPFAFLLILFLLGLALGSFLSVLIYRLHTGKPGILWGKSICPHCNKTLGAFELIPLFSYLIQGGKCRGCKRTIPWHYPVLELSNGLLFVGIALAQFTPLPLYLFYGLVLIFVFFYDLLYMEIPDEVMFPSIAVALLATFHFEVVLWQSALLGAGGLVAFFLIQILLSHGRWLGGGDLRIGAFMGLILGWQLTLVAVFVSYLLGSIMSLVLLSAGRVSRKSMIAFGPFLVLGTLVALFYGQPLLTWYVTWLGL